MAGRNHRLLKQTYRLFASAGGEADGPTAAAFASSPVSSAVGDDFEESDVWGSALDDGGDDAGFDYGGKMAKSGLHGARGAPRKATQGMGAVTASLPVNIPDWSKILQEECVKRSRGGYRRGGEEEEEYEDEEAEGGTVVPPHEYLWRKRGAVASFSVHEGVGRTLKGRDLSRVRNAVWRQTGFQD